MRQLYIFSFKDVFTISLFRNPIPFEHDLTISHHYSFLPTFDPESSPPSNLFQKSGPSTLGVRKNTFPNQLASCKGQSYTPEMTTVAAIGLSHRPIRTPHLKRNNFYFYYYYYNK